jgi:hypothetical protein
MKGATLSKWHYQNERTLLSVCIATQRHYGSDQLTMTF